LSRSINFSINASISGSITIEDSVDPLTTIMAGVFTAEDNVLLQVLGTDIGARWLWSGGETQVGDNFSAGVDIGETIVLRVENPGAIERITMIDTGVDAPLPDFSLLPNLQRFSANGNAFDGSFPTNLPASLERFLVNGSPIIGPLVDLSGTSLTHLDVSDCDIESVDVGFAVPSSVTSLLATGNGIPEAGIDAILAACVAAGVMNATIALEGGSNAAPSPSGLADKATLEGDGCTVTVTSSELITNGSFATDTDWDKGGGWAIGGGEAVYTSGGGGGALSQDFGALTQPLTNGNNYTLSFDVSNPNNGLVTVTMSGGTGSQVVYSSPTDGAGKTANFTASSARTTVLFLSASDEPISVDNVSLLPS
jgi:hypothetical protein